VSRALARFYRLKTWITQGSGVLEISPLIFNIGSSALPLKSISQEVRPGIHLARGKDEIEFFADGHIEVQTSEPGPDHVTSGNHGPCDPRCEWLSGSGSSSRRSTTDC